MESPRGLGGDGRDEARVDAAAQEHAHRHVGVDPVADCAPKGSTNALDGFSLGYRGDVAAERRPVAGDRGVAGRTVAENAGGRQLADAAEHAVRGRNGAVYQVASDGAVVQLRGRAQQLRERRHCRREGQPARRPRHSRAASRRRGRAPGRGRASARPTARTRTSLGGAGRARRAPIAGSRGEAPRCRSGTGRQRGPRAPLGARGSCRSLR